MSFPYEIRTTHELVLLIAETPDGKPILVCFLDPNKKNNYGPLPNVFIKKRIG